MKTSTVPGKSWFRIENKATAEPASIFIYDEIGSFGTSADDFVKQLRDVKASAIDVHLNSPGGECYDGLAIFNALRSHKANVTVYIDGLAASAASFVAMAGDRIVAERNATLMIHNAHAVGVGDADDMRKLADMLDRMSDTIADIYAERAGGTVAQWRARMKTETWFNADEAKAAGLVDEVTAAAPPRGMPRNMWDLSIFNFAGRAAAPDPFSIVVDEPPPRLEAMACPSHDTATTEGAWDAGAQVGRMPSPMPVAMAKKMYGWYDAARVDNGEMPKDAGKLPHHEVDANGMPGAANLAGVRNALARLSQSDIPESDMAAVQAHLRAHLAAAQQPADHTHVAPAAEVAEEAPTILGVFDPAQFRDAIKAAAELQFDASQFRDIMASLAYDAPAAPAPQPKPVNLGPPPPPPPPGPPDPTPWDATRDTIRAAISLVANDMPAPNPTPQTDPVPPEPEPSIDLPAFRRSIKEARL